MPGQKYFLLAAIYSLGSFLCISACGSPEDSSHARRTTPKGSLAVKLAANDTAGGQALSCHTEGVVTFCLVTSEGANKRLEVTTPAGHHAFPIRTLAGGSQLYHWGDASKFEVGAAGISLHQDGLDAILSAGYQRLRSGTYASLFAWDSIVHGDNRIVFSLPHDTDVVVVDIERESCRDDKHPFYASLCGTPQRPAHSDGTTSYLVTPEQLGRLTRGVGAAGLLEVIDDDGEEFGRPLKTAHVIFHSASPLVDARVSTSSELIADITTMDDQELRDHAQPMSVLQLLMLARLTQHLLAEDDSRQAAVETVYERLRAWAGERPQWRWLLTAASPGRDGDEASSRREEAWSQIPDDGMAALGRVAGGDIDREAMCRLQRQILAECQETVPQAVVGAVVAGLCGDGDRAP